MRFCAINSCFTYPLRDACSLVQSCICDEYISRHAYNLLRCNIFPSSYQEISLKFTRFTKNYYKCLVNKWKLDGTKSGVTFFRAHNLSFLAHGRKTCSSQIFTFVTRSILRLVMFSRLKALCEHWLVLNPQTYCIRWSHNKKRLLINISSHARPLLQWNNFSKWKTLNTCGQHFKVPTFVQKLRIIYTLSVSAFLTMVPEIQPFNTATWYHCTCAGLQSGQWTA